MKKYLFLAGLISLGNNLAASDCALSIPINDQDPLKTKKEALLSFITDLQLLLNASAKGRDILSFRRELSTNRLEFSVIRQGGEVGEKNPPLTSLMLHFITKFTISLPKALNKDEVENLCSLLDDILVKSKEGILETATPKNLSELAAWVRLVDDEKDFSNHDLMDMQEKLEIIRSSVPTH